MPPSGPAIPVTATRDVGAEPLPRPLSHGSSGLSGYRAVLPEHLIWYPERTGLDRVRVRDRRTDEYVARPGDRREPFGDHPPRARFCGGERQLPLAAQAKHDLLDGRRVVAGVHIRCERRGQPFEQRLGTHARTLSDDEIDVDLEVVRADGRLYPVPVAAGVGKRLRNRRFGHAEAPE